jgi:hypothetical protein
MPRLARGHNSLEAVTSHPRQSLPTQGSHDSSEAVTSLSRPTMARDIVMIRSRPTSAGDKVPIRPRPTSARDVVPIRPRPTSMRDVVPIRPSASLTRLSQTRFARAHLRLTIASHDSPERISDSPEGVSGDCPERPRQPNFSNSSPLDFNSWEDLPVT